MAIRLYPYSTGHKDSVPADAISERHFRALLDQTIDGAGDDLRGRSDAAAMSIVRRWDAAGLAPAAILTDRLTQILATPYPAADGLTLIPQRQYTPLGFEHTEIGRTDISGTVAQARGGAAIPRVDVSLETEIFDVAYYVCAFAIEMWERMSVLNRVLNLASSRMDAARIIHARSASNRIWDGDAVSGLPGVLNHPFIPVSIGATDYVDPATSADDIIADFADARYYTADNTSDVGRNDTVLMASKIARRLASRPRSTTSDITILKFLQDTHPDLKFVPTHSLNDKGPNGEHGMVFFDAADPNSLFHDLIQPTTFLAPQTVAFEDIVYVWMGTGGVKALNAFNDNIYWTPN